MISLQDRRKAEQVARELWGQKRGRLSAFLVLIDHLNSKTGQAFPSYIRIATLAKCSEQTVASMIEDAEGAGLLTVIRSYRWAVVRGVKRWVRAVNRYTLVLTKTAVEASEAATQALSRLAITRAVRKLQGTLKAAYGSDRSPQTSTQGLLPLDLSGFGVPLQDLELDRNRPPLPAISRPASYGLINLKP